MNDFRYMQPLTKKRLFKCVLGSHVWVGRKVNRVKTPTHEDIFLTEYCFYCGQTRVIG